MKFLLCSVQIGLGLLVRMERLKSRLALGKVAVGPTEVQVLFSTLVGQNNRR